MSLQVANELRLVSTVSVSYTHLDVYTRQPFKELSGCGVGFKLCQGLNTIYKIPEAELFELTDLLAISIAADIVSMTGENRVLAKQGLKVLRKTRNLGLRMLIPEDKLATFEISKIVFEIAPKINAAGRSSHGKAAVELMLSLIHI